MPKYDHQKIEGKWRKKWQENKLYSPDIKKAQKPFYNLMMFPYPSSEGLHVGNMYAFTGADVYGRFQRMRGMDVFEPIGLDGFGIHSENYAISIGKHPKVHAKSSEKNYYRQLEEIGNGFVWDKRLETYDPDYYRWTQWLFIQMFKRGLAYKGSAMVNWCPSCKTVLADEQAEGGKCERCKKKVGRRPMRSWYFRITKYANRLLENIEKIDWPERIKIAQRQWIGKSEGVIVDWKIDGVKKDVSISTFTTRLDTIYGVTFLVLAPEHKAVGNYIWSPEVRNFAAKFLNKPEQERKLGKRGIDTGYKATHPLTGKPVPIFIAEFVLKDYGTGAVMGVPAHDQRDLEFAREHGLEVKRAVMGPDKKKGEIRKEAMEEKGKLVNSTSKYNNLTSEKASNAMLKDLGNKARTEVQYHLRDWLISRQRYWGPPIPMVNCEKCDWQPVPEKDLPVELPDIANFKPKGDGTSPLSNAPDSWKITKCPKCKGKAKRELDVSDTFLDSSWYFLAYPNLDTKKWKDGPSASPSQAFFDKKTMDAWLPVDAYIGGAEHAVLHLLYSRFVTMALFDWGYLSFEEPFPFLYGHGLIIKDGAKMSKSKGNIVIPDEYIKKYGADALRTYLMFLGPYDQGGDFRDTGIEGMSRFLNRVWEQFDKASNKKDGADVSIKLHQTIKKVTEDIEKFRYNTAIAVVMELVNSLKEQKQINSKTLKILAQLMAPFTPYFSEEVWDNLDQKGSIHISLWPEYDKSLVKEKELTIIVQVNGKLRGTLKVSSEKSKSKKEIVEMAKNNKRIKKWLAKKKIKNTIFVSGKLVNFVTK